VKLWQWARATFTDEFVANILLHVAFRYRNNPRALGPSETDAPHLYSGDLDAFFGTPPETVSLPEPGPARWSSPLWTVHDASLPSSSPSGWPDSDRIWIRRWIPTATARAEATRSGGPVSPRTVIGVHGIVQRGTRWFNWLADQLAPRGIEILTVDSPFNYRRAPRGYFPGQLIVGGDLGHQLQVTRQAVRDTWQIVRSVQSQGREVALCGVSYGGFISLLTTLLADDLQATVAVTPPVNTLRLLQEGGTLIRAIRMGLGKEPLDISRLDALTAPLIPQRHQPRLPGHRIHLHIARYDRFVKADHIRELAALWNTRTSEYPDGHYSVTMQPTLIAPLASGLLEIWDAPRSN